MKYKKDENKGLIIGMTFGFLVGVMIGQFYSISIRMCASGGICIGSIIGIFIENRVKNKSLV